MEAVIGGISGMPAEVRRARGANDDAPGIATQGDGSAATTTAGGSILLPVAVAAR